MPRELTETIYASVQAPELWREAAAGLADVLGASTVVVASELQRGSFSWRRGDFFIKAESGPAKSALASLLRQPVLGLTMTVEDAAPDLAVTRPIVRRSEGPTIGEWLHAAGRVSGDSRVCHVAAARGPGQGSFSVGEIERFLEAARHLIRATSMSERLGREGSDRVWREAIDAMSIGVCVLGEDGSFVSANAEGRRLLDDARHVSIVNGKLRLSRPDKAAEFQDLLSSMATKSQDRGAVMTGEDGESEEFLVGLVRAGEGGPLVADEKASPQPSIIAYMREVDKDYRRLEGVLRQAFRLTRMEARTTIAVLHGLGIDEAAKTLGLAPATVRSHVKSVFSKTGVQRQSQLVHRTLGGVLSLLI